MILMENTDWSSVKNSASAPYINRTLLPIASHAERYYNPPNLHSSLPNYLWLEAGTNFGILDNNLPAQNHQGTSNHLVNLLEAAGISWNAYQEDEGAGAFDGTDCPFTHEGNFYDVNHNPFVYFDDVTGNMNPSAPRCLQHVRPYSEFLTDLGNNTVPPTTSSSRTSATTCTRTSPALRVIACCLATPGCRRRCPRSSRPRPTSTTARSSSPGTRVRAATARSA